jgi:uncharacterized protein YndB with AHSA1/START domain
VTAETRLQIVRFLAAPVERVFSALTDPAQMSRWFFAGEAWTAEATNDLRVGGEYRVTMISDAGDRIVCSGVYRAIEPPSRLVFTWTSYAVTDTVVTVELRVLGNGTELTLTHDGLVDAGVRELHGQGWGGCLASLERYLSAARS